MEKEFYFKQFCLIALVGLVTNCRTHHEVSVPQLSQIVEYVVISPGENLTALSKITEGEYKCDNPYGGDDGKNLFFVVYTQGNGCSNIFKKESPTVLSMSQNTSGNNHNIGPSYCPKNNMIAFAGRFGNTGTHDIYMTNATQGSALVQVTNTINEDENYPSINPQGTKIVYEKKPSNSLGTSSQIWIKNLVTNENTMIGNGRMPSFSKDGKKIVFVKYANDGWNTCVWTMNEDGTGSLQITSTNLGVVWHPRFSPDGEKILFQCAKQQKRDFDLYVVDKNGNNLTQLTINDSYDGDPYWANDGNIYFASDRGNKDSNYQIWRFRYGSSKPIPPVPPVPENKDMPSSPYLYHTVQSGETITNIARNYGITVKDVVKWNKLKTMTISSGMKLIVGSQR